MDIKSIVFFANGNTAVCNSKGKQMPELQKSWLVHFLQSLDIADYNKIEVLLPSGRTAKIFETSDGGLNWEIV